MYNAGLDENKSILLLSANHSPCVCCLDLDSKACGQVRSQPRPAGFPRPPDVACIETAIGDTQGWVCFKFAAKQRTASVCLMTLVYLSGAAASSSVATIPEQEILKLTKEFVNTGFQRIEDSADMLSEDFIFRGPGVHPALVVNLWLTRIIIVPHLTGVRDTVRQHYGLQQPCMHNAATLTFGAQCM
jgi:hypothetical protein